MSVSFWLTLTRSNLVINNQQEKVMDALINLTVMLVAVGVGYTMTRQSLVKYLEGRDSE